MAFVNWTGDVADPTSASTSVTMNGNKTVTANFSQITYTLTMAVAGNGNTTPVVGAYSNYNYGYVVNIMAIQITAGSSATGQVMWLTQTRPIPPSP